MVWLVIIGIFVVAFGPLMWLRPSARERRQSRLRQRAFELGMRVELRRLPRHDLAPEERVSAGGRARDTSREYAAYLKPLPAKLKVLPAWRVLRQGDGTTAVPGWCFEAGARPADPRLADAMAVVGPVLADLPEDVIAVECQPLTLAGYWLEGPDTTPERVDDLERRLGTAAAALAGLDARLQAPAEPGKI